MALTRLKTFPGGLHPADNKQWTSAKPIEALPLPEELIIPLSQHIGAPAEACVEVGARVKKGEVIGQAKGFVSVPVHASTSGEVTAVEPRLHPSGRNLPAVVIKPDGEDVWLENLPKADPDSLSADELKDRLRAAGIVGMGGATFPAHVKLSPPAEKPIDTLIINGVECEPYLTADHRVMLEESERVLQGVDILRRILNVDNIYIGIEVNKLDAIALMREKCAGRGIEVVPLQVKYPQGAEKQLILAITGREVPSGGLPMEVGVVVQNVGTTAAVADAIIKGYPLIERACTVTGSGVNEQKNLRIRVGTPLQHMVDYCGGLNGDPAKLIMGGPMMGMTQLSLDVPATRGTSGLLIFREGDIDLRQEGPCIRCARCVKACPVNLLPTTIASYTRLDMFDEAEAYHAMDCIECGCCSYSCPSLIPLIQTLRHAKAAILEKRRKL